MMRLSADIGSVTWIVTQQGTTNNYSATRLGYAMNGSTVTYALGETWEWDGVSSCPAGPTGYDIAWAREFRYDSGRARYLNRQLDTGANGLMHNPPKFVAVIGGETWTDYDGDEAYGDFSVNGGVPTNLRSYQPGIATVDPWISTGPNSTDYFVTDHLGTTRGVTLPPNAGSAPADAATFSAFGEKISGENHRFGYVGQFGYQAHAEMPFLHVGARYYDPASGRFLQRDRIGIRGGTNVYAYASGIPTAFIDSTGLITEASPELPLVMADLADLLGAVDIAKSVGVTAVATITIYPGQRTPSTGEPDSSEAFDEGNGKGTIRDYGPDGKAETDYDFGHDHGSGDPHAHDWDWSKTPPRQVHRPLYPCE